MIAIGQPSCAWPMPNTRLKKSGIHSSTNHQTASVSILAPITVQLFRSRSSSPQGTEARSGRSPSGRSWRVPTHQNPNQMKHSAPVTTKAAFHPKAMANGGISKGVTIAPMLDEVLITPMARLRCFCGR